MLSRKSSSALSLRLSPWRSILSGPRMARRSPAAMSHGSAAPSSRLYGWYWRSRFPRARFWSSPASGYCRVAVGKSFHAPLSLLIVLAVWGVVNSVSTVVGILLNGAGILKQQMVVAIAVSLTNLALSIYLTRRFGVIGVCLGSILTQAAITLPVYSFIIRNRFKTLAIIRNAKVSLQPTEVYGATL